MSKRSCCSPKGARTKPGGRSARAARVSDEIVGFHCQQAAEKLLKAVLSDIGVAFQRTHNLRQLMDMLSDAAHPLPPDLDDIDILTPYGTTFRYDMLPVAHDFRRTDARDMVRRLACGRSES